MAVVLYGMSCGGSDVNSIFPLLGVISAIVGAVVAYFVPRAIGQSRAVSVMIASICTTLTLVVANQIVWANTNRDLIQHATCFLIPSGQACIPSSGPVNFEDSTGDTLSSTGPTSSRSIRYFAHDGSEITHGASGWGPNADYIEWATPQLGILLPDTDQYDVHTTLDLRLQKRANELVNRMAQKGIDSQLISIDEDGAILAFAGEVHAPGRRKYFNESHISGTAWNIFVYLAALEEGFSTVGIRRPSSKCVELAPELRSGIIAADSDTASYLAGEVGIGVVNDMAGRFVISEIDETNRITPLGKMKMWLYDYVRVVGSLANNGKDVAPYAIHNVVGHTGKVLYEHSNDDGQVLVTDFVAAEMVALLRSTATSGSARHGKISRPTFALTGGDASNAWYAGSTGDINTAVWVGRQNGRRLPVAKSGSEAAQLFADYMTVAVEGRPSTESIAHQRSKPVRC